MELWALAALVWIACAVLCGFLAPSKGRPSGQWFWTGFFFGVFALAALAIAEPVERASLRTCAHCGKAVDPSRDRLCDHCGLPFAA